MNLNSDLHLGFHVSISHDDMYPSPLFPWVMGKNLWLSSSWAVLSLSYLYFSWVQDHTPWSAGIIPQHSYIKVYLHVKLTVSHILL